MRVSTVVLANVITLAFVSPHLDSDGSDQRTSISLGVNPARPITKP